VRKIKKRDTMKKIIKMATILFTFGLLVGPAFTSDEFTSVGGEWLITISGKERGTAYLNFSVPVSGFSMITGTGFIEGTGGFFYVLEDPAQLLTIESDGNIVGDIGITDSEGSLLGTLSIARGKTKYTFTRLVLTGTFTEAGGSPEKVNLKGIRLSDPPALEGNTFAGKIGGEGLSSKSFPLTVIENEDLEGFPFMSMVGIGSVKIDGVETPSVGMSSNFIVDEMGKVLGDFNSSVLGSGELKGSLQSGDEGPILNFKVTISEPESRRFTIRAELNSAVGGKLVVTPATNPVDFGETLKGTPKNQIFVLTNTGGKRLSGEASLQGAGAGEFSVLSGSPYDISPAKTATVTVEFKAQNTGTFDAQIRFTGDIDGDLIINISATANP